MEPAAGLRLGGGLVPLSLLKVKAEWLLTSAGLLRVADDVFDKYCIALDILVQFK